MRELSGLLFTLTGSSGTVRSAAQLAARVNMLRFQRGDVASLARQDIERRGTPVDDAVQDALEFARSWASSRFRGPRRRGGSRHRRPRRARVADVGVFAGEIENMFLPPFVTVLEEYGLPAPVTLKLDAVLQPRRVADLDALLQRIRDLTAVPDLSPFEAEMLQDTRSGL